ncbi:hypothetical protein HZC34_05305 [Candidatus Saganbacteria bacterium]|nr:hypothetical protein [Candidatus Saganbacteria bacterium]
MNGMMVGKMDRYLKSVTQTAGRVVLAGKQDVHACSSLMRTSRRQGNDVVVFGTGADFSLASHAQVDWIKSAQLKIVSLGSSTITAFGNDYPSEDLLSRFLHLRGFGNHDLLVGFHLDGPNPVLEEAFAYNYDHNGINLLIGRSAQPIERTHCFVRIDSESSSTARDVAQVIMHYLGVNQAFELDSTFHDLGARSLSGYWELLLRSLEQDQFSLDILSQIASLIRAQVFSGHSLFSFGNGACTTFSSYLTEGLRHAFRDRPKAYRNIVDLTAFVEAITLSISQGRYKKEGFANMLSKLGVAKGDVLFGMSASGNSENIAHAFRSFPQARRIGLLGFGDGGVIGREPMKELAFLVPDEGCFRSYTRAEDGQRIALSLILTALAQGEEANAE